jgi:hypothetical protein
MRGIILFPLVAAAGVAAAQTVPDYRALQASEGIAAHAARNGGDTASMSALAAGGQGILYSPGRIDADACASASDPRCRAVQVVDRGGIERPVIDPDPTGAISAMRRAVTQSAPDTVTLGGFSMSAANCRPVTSEVSTPPVTRTCEEQTVQIIGSSEERTCTIESVPVTSLTSTYACSETYAERFAATCSVPVVAKTRTVDTWACLEGQQNAQSRSCTLAVSAPVKSYHIAACTRGVYRVSEKTCVRRLSVIPGETCSPGSVQSASHTDSAALAEDAVPGMDTLTLSYTCAAEKGRYPTLALQANGGASLLVSAKTFDSPVVVGGNTARFAGELSCEGATCTADVTLTVYQGTGSSRVRTGDIHRLFAFTRYQKTAEAEYWIEECTR